MNTTILMKDNPRTCSACSTPLPDDAPGGLCPQCLMQGVLTPGERIQYFGNYELLEEIALGGMGIVWRARQTSLNRVVALKMIRGGILAGGEDVKRFRAEAEAAAGLQHPNIVAIHEIGEHEGQHYFSMDFVEGQNLDAFGDGRPLVSERAAQLLATIAGAVEFAHQRGIVHRDLKPQNVMIDAAGQPRLTDFGLAKRMDLDSGLTQTGAIIGSPSYMAPEQAQGRHDLIGVRSDVYSLGAILYATLTGRAPFQAATAMETMRQVVDAEPAPPRRVNPSVPADLETICLKCLEKDPARRYASAQEFADDLTRFLRHEPIHARPATAFDRARKWAKREPAQVVTLGVIVAAVLVLLGGVLLANRGLNQRYWQSLLNLARAERFTQNRARSLDAIAEAARIRIDPGLRDEAIQTLAQAGVRLERRVPYGKEASFALSADGDLLMAAGTVDSYPGSKRIETPRVKVWETATGKLLNEIAWEPLGPLPAFSPDSRVVALPQADDVIVIWEPRTGKELGRVPGKGALMFSPDNQWLAIAESNSVKIVRWANPKEEKRRASGAFLTFTSDGVSVVRDGERIVKWNFREGGESFLTPEDLSVIAIDLHGTVAALWEPAKPGKASAPRPATDNSDPPGSIIVFDLAAQKRVVVLPTMRSTPTSVRFSADGRLLAFLDMTGLEYAAGQQAVRIYDVEAGQYRQSLTGISPKPGPFKHWRAWWKTNQWNLDFNAASPAAIYGGEFLGDGSLFAAMTGLNNLYVTVWNTETGEVVATLPKSTEFAASADGRRLASVSEGSFMHYANGETYASNMDDSILAQTAGVPSGARKLPRGPGSLGGAVVGTTGLVLHIGSVAAGVPTIQGGTEIHTLAFNRDGRMLTAGGQWGYQVSSRLWKVAVRGERAELHPVKDLPAVTTMLFGAGDEVWGVRSSQDENNSVILQQFMPDRREVPLRVGQYNTGPAFTPDGRQALVVGYGTETKEGRSVRANRTLLVVDLATMKVTESHPEMDASNWATGVIAFSPDGKRFASSAFVTQGLDVFDTATLTHRWHAQRPQLTEGQILRIRLGWLFGKGQGRTYDEFGVHHIAFTPDGRRIASVSANFLIIRDADTGAELGVGYGHDGYIQSLAVSPDGKFAVTGGLDRTIRVWEIPTARELARWEAHDSAVTALAFSPDGATLASGSIQGAIKLWNLPALRRELAALELDW